MLQAAQIASAVGLAANPWSDEDFRNLWDRVENVGTTLGLGYATYSALRSNDEASDQMTSIGWGLLLASAGKGVSSILGNQTGEQFEKKARFIEFTRRAYDELQTIYFFTQADIESNLALRKEIATFRSDYRAAATIAEKRDRLVLASAYLARYDLVLTQIPALVRRYRGAVERFCPGAIQAVLDDRATGYECQVPEGGTTYSLEGESGKKLIAAARQVVQMEATLVEANANRVLSSRLRQALLTGA